MPRTRRRLAGAAVAALLIAIGPLILTALATLAACGSDDPEPSPSPSGSLQYADDDLGFSISRDAAFETTSVYEAPLARFKIGFLDVVAPGSGEAPDELLVTGFGERELDGLATPEGRQTVLDQVVDQMIAASRGERRSWKRTTIAGLPAAVSTGPDDDAKGRRVTCVIVGTRDVYVLTGEASDATWDEKLPLFVEAFETFREL